MPDLLCPHCQTEVDEHEAGRCLDAWVADVVMDYFENYSGATAEYVTEGMFDMVNEHGWRVEVIPAPHYSTDIAAAWKVVERLLEKDRISSISFGGWDNKQYTTYVVSIYNFDEEASKAPLAICRAALRASEISRD